MVKVGFSLIFSGKQRKIAKYYKQQESLLQGFTEMENIHELGYLDGTPTDVPFYFIFLKI
jgi:Cation efflux family